MLDHPNTKYTCAIGNWSSDTKPTLFKFCTVYQIAFLGNPDIQWISMVLHISTNIHDGQHSHAILEDKETSSNNQTSWNVGPPFGLRMP